MRKVIFLLIFIAGCASSPEQQLAQGYDTATSVVNTTNTLLLRKAISIEDAKNVSASAKAAKASLDAGKERLALCRARKQECDNATATISMGAGLLLQLEQFLEAREGAK